MWSIFVHAFGILLACRAILAAAPISPDIDGEGSTGSILVSPNATDYIPLRITSPPPLVGAGKIYTIDIVDTTITLRIAISDDELIDIYILRQTFVAMLETAREKAAVWGGTTYLHLGDDPFRSDTHMFPQVDIELQSESRNKRSKARLKYGRVVLILRALNTFLCEQFRPRSAVVAITDAGLLIGQGMVTARNEDGLGSLEASNATAQLK